MGFSGGGGVAGGKHFRGGGGCLNIDEKGDGVGQNSVIKKWNEIFIH